MKFILTGDNHFMWDTPICRTDNFRETQVRKMNWLKELQEAHNAIIINSGDLTHKYREDRQNDFLHMLLPNLPKQYSIAGNHDVKYHNIENLPVSTIGILNAVGAINLLGSEPTSFGDVDVYGFHWGQPITPPLDDTKINIAVTHQMVFAPKDNLAEHISGVPCATLLKDNPGYDLILTGDNHKTFTIEHDGHTLVNPGSLLRITSAQIDFKPSVFIFDSETKKIEQIMIPIEDVVTNTHNAVSNTTKDFEAYIEQMKDGVDVSINFQENVDLFLRKHNISDEITKKVLEFMEV
jgi:exonuclease SbcD